MNRFALIALTSFVLMFGGTLAGHAKVRSLDDLSRKERYALDESRWRAIVYDYALQDLDQKRTKHRIGQKTYQHRYADLMRCISDESAYQNEILLKGSRVEPDSEPGSEFAATVEKDWDDYGKYLFEVPAALALMAVEGLGHSGASITPGNL